MSAGGRAGGPLLLAAALAAAGSTCGGERGAEHGAAERGGAIFSSSDLSRNTFNDLACADCHATSAADARRLSGANLAGAVLRPSYWGGEELDLLESVNQCLTAFMLETKGLAADDPRAIDLYAFLASLPPDLPDAQPFTFVRTIGPMPAGDAARGAPLYASACAFCHGATHTGEGRAVEFQVVLPETTLEVHGDDPSYDVRTVFAEKIRHGRFYGFGGFMPPFSSELLSDQDVGDLLAYLGQ